MRRSNTPPLPTPSNRRALYDGHEVVVTSRRWVTGGFVCDVRRSENATSWPWTATEFTTAETSLRYLDAIE